jgi:hypothetical protein
MSLNDRERAGAFCLFAVAESPSQWSNHMVEIRLLLVKQSQNHSNIATASSSSMAPAS